MTPKVEKTISKAAMLAMLKKAHQKPSRKKLTEHKQVGISPDLSALTGLLKDPELLKKEENEKPKIKTKPPTTDNQKKSWSKILTAKPKVKIIKRLKQKKQKREPAKKQIKQKHAFGDIPKELVMNLMAKEKEQQKQQKKPGPYDKQKSFYKHLREKYAINAHYKILEQLPKIPGSFKPVKRMTQKEIKKQFPGAFE